MMDKNIPDEEQLLVDVKTLLACATKEVFTTGPILKHEDPSLHIVVEVNTLKTGMGVVISQQLRDHPKLYHMAFLSPAERYDIGNPELI